MAQLLFHLYIDFRSVILSVCDSRSPLPGDHPWQVRYEMKVHKPGIVGIIFNGRIDNRWLSRRLKSMTPN